MGHEHDGVGGDLDVVDATGRSDPDHAWSDRSQLRPDHQRLQSAVVVTEPVECGAEPVRHVGSGSEHGVAGGDRDVAAVDRGGAR